MLLKDGAHQIGPEMRREALPLNGEGEVAGRRLIMRSAERLEAIDAVQGSSSSN